MRGNGDDTATMSTAIRTLAYVVSTCRVDATGVGFVEQDLRIQVGDGAPVSVRGVNARVDGTQPQLCHFLGDGRLGQVLQAVLPFKRLAVTPDGSRVVFEIAAPLPQHLALVRDPTVAVDEGIYVVRSDGTGLRRLGSPSREPAFRITGIGVTFLTFPGFAPSPDGQRVVFTDRGDGPDGEAIQIVSLDLDSGRRAPLTTLPPGPHDPCPVIADSICKPGTTGPFFLNDEEVVFFSEANPDGMNPAGDLTAFIVNQDGTGLRSGPRPSSLPNGVLDPSFVITGRAPSVVVLPLDAPPEGPPEREAFPFTLEVFLLDGENLLQLTDFKRNDIIDAALTANGERVLFSASANRPAAGPAGDDIIRQRNPTENCQVFSIDRNGGDLRQLTDFRETDHVRFGCYNDIGLVGCSVGFFAVDPMTGTLVFYSTCDPFGQNPYGGQLFAMRPDGSGLRQITDARGLTPDGMELELIGPHAYSAPIRMARPR